ncbi:hybrid sensor histidine kinase/response regulator [Thioflexithrix psekupsensis]|uniref:histidine kinase n=1 Tax=Thioflexithrix psekupsensis TaxID=1570016 RepID=A0A251X4I8_9GAMM|nr:hybrid sensor histidine kinase/response regulator [Thioflexithrix psekupsensis]OUD12300.1 hypothetical protein TPSD3_14375 [Thioflexithrix psekupsensis]
MQSLLCVIWFILYIRYHHNYASIAEKWLWIEILLNALSGLGWGLCWVLFINPDSLGSVILLNAMISGVLTAYAIATPLHKLATATCMSFCIFPIVIKSLFFMTNPVFYWLGMASLLLLIFAYMFSLKLHDLYLKMLLQVEENIGLVNELQKEKQQLEQLNIEKTRFLAAASHDLRQPIQAMKLFIDILASLLTQTPQKEILSKIEESSQSLSGLLEPLLDISRLDSGTIKPQPQWIYIDDLFYHIEQQYNGFAAKNQITLRCVSTSQQAFIDSAQLERILSNLVDNAIKHMKRKGKIVLGLRKQKHGFRIEVWDNGQGVPEAEHEKIFYEFYQVDNPERNRNKGIGLGLSIVKRLTKLMGGQLTFRSVLGKGCYFSLYFPLIEGEKTIVQETKIIPLLDETIALPQANVLIIEDDNHVIEALIRLLEHWGLNTRHAYNAETALSTLDTFSPDLILTDYQLQQGETGLAIIKLVEHHLNRPIPSLIITGNTSEDTVKFLQTLPIPVFYKPIAAGKLKLALYQLLK